MILNNKEYVNILFKEALKVRENAYVPYSKFKVGAAILTEKGNIYTGCNVENSSFGLTVCAERNAVFKAVSNGEKNFRCMVVVADTKEPVSPCGACRQVVSEFGDFEIILSNLNGDFKYTSVKELLPYNFSEEHLNEK
jgi:cytidine deaminase